MTMITPSYLGETIEYSSLHACRSTLEDPTMASSGCLSHFVPLDISEEILLDSARAIHEDYEVDVTALHADFASQLHVVPREGRRLFTFLGSTIGNFDPPARSCFFADLALSMEAGDRFLLGADLVKTPTRLLAAYDDALGVTAEFNRNVLRVINAELAANFDPEAFAHRAVWDEANSWIEMRLVARDDQLVSIPTLGLEVLFRSGEEMRTEISAKFEAPRLDRELAACGLETEARWLDPDGDFQLLLARPSR